MDPRFSPCRSRSPVARRRDRERSRGLEVRERIHHGSSEGLAPLIRDETRQSVLTIQRDVKQGCSTLFCDRLVVDGPSSRDRHSDRQAKGSRGDDYPGDAMPCDNCDSPDFLWFGSISRRSFPGMDGLCRRGCRRIIRPLARDSFQIIRRFHDKCLVPRQSSMDA